MISTPSFWAVPKRAFKHLCKLLIVILSGAKNPSKPNQVELMSFGQPPEQIMASGMLHFVQHDM